MYLSFGSFEQTGCNMGFSITACVLTAIMFITYCVAITEHSEILRCKHTRYHGGTIFTNTYCYSSRTRHIAAVGTGLGSCLLIFSVVEFFMALASSIYCCGAICCNTPEGVVNTVSTNCRGF